MFAVIKTGGKQYVVKEGDVVAVEKLEGEVGGSLSFETLLVSDESGAKLSIGTPALSSLVQGSIVAHGRAKKVSVVKYKPKVRYRKRVGHRQAFTKVKIEKIAA
jgi:large subunit ribosomal protein L21